MGVHVKTASEEVTDMIFLSKWSSQTLCAGAELGVFDCLSRDGTRTANDVAAETCLDPTLLYRLLRALASLGLLNETSGRHFNLTERGAILRTDAPGSLRYMAMLEGGPEHWAIETGWRENKQVTIFRSTGIFKLVRDISRRKQGVARSQQKALIAHLDLQFAGHDVIG